MLAPMKGTLEGTMIALVSIRGASIGATTRLRSAAIPNFSRRSHVVDDCWGLNLVNRYQI